MYQKILVGFNGSAGSIKALSWSIDWLTKHPESELEVLFVAQASHLVIGEAYVPSQKITKERTYAVGESILAQARNALQAASIKANIVMSEGRPASMLNEYAEDHQCDVIVIGCSRKRMWPGWGSSTKCEQIILGSSRPVLVVK